MSKFLSKRFETLEAYTPGEQPQDKTYVKLNTNESPYSPSPLVAQRVNASEVENLNLYPDLVGKRLKEKIAELYGVKMENVFLSNGSDEILNFVFMAFCDKEKGAFFPEISYGFYPVYGDLYEIPYQQIPLQADFSVNHKDYCDCGNMVVIANPNAPTGMEIGLAEIEEIVRTNPNQLVLIDEAYVDFGGTSCVGLVEKYDNLLVCMTFSKSRSMAGSRLGFAIGNAEIITDLEKIKFSTNPYNINRLTLVAGEAAIDSNEYYIDNAKKIIETRQGVVSQLQELGFIVLDSKANFLFVSSPEVAGEALYERLKQKGVLVRHFKKEKIKDFIRVTIGTPEQMDLFIEKVKEILDEGKAKS